MVTKERAFGTVEGYERYDMVEDENAHVFDKIRDRCFDSCLWHIEVRGEAADSTKSF